MVKQGKGIGVNADFHHPPSDRSVFKSCFSVEHEKPYFSIDEYGKLNSLVEGQRAEIEIDSTPKTKPGLAKPCLKAS
jgi:hypothetical protein